MFRKHKYENRLRLRDIYSKDIRGSKLQFNDHNNDKKQPDDDDDDDDDYINYINDDESSST